jgi:histone H3/H4
MSDNEVLVVASKLKNYIKQKGDMKTSGAVLQVLSDRIRGLCDEAIESANRDGRKTVLDRDFS